MEIYLDHASTTPPIDAVKEALKYAVDHCYGNPSSLHKMGMQSEKAIKHVRNQMASFLKCNEKEILFTSGGTESNNLAIKGIVGERKGRLITSVIEHPSVKSAFESFEKKGYDVVYLPVDSEGTVNVDALKNALSPETLLVSVMHVNNETGSIQPIEKIGKIIAQFNQENHSTIRFHVDAVQSFGKLPINLSKLAVDLMSFSAHKINGIKGTGALYIKSTCDVKALFHGGQQEYGIRPGTENLYGIMSFGVAIEEQFKNMRKLNDQMIQLKNTLMERLNEIDFIEFNAPNGSPYILNISILGTKGEVMLHSLEMEGIYVSTGSACSSKKKNQSHVLKAMGLTDERMDSAIRLSFGHGIDMAMIEMSAEKIIQTGQMLRNIIQKKGR